MHKESGKDVYFEELFNRYFPMLYGVCLKYLKDTDEAQDVILQLFSSLCFKIADYEIDEFRPWIYSVTKNYCLQKLNNEEHSIAVDFEENSEEFNNVMRFLEEIDLNKKTEFISDCLSKLPEQQRLSLNYFFQDKLSYAEIADKTGYTLKHVKSYIWNGKEKLKSCLENNGL